jgi:hypothetical protein
MIMKHTYLLASVSALFLVGCGSTAEPTEQEKAAIQRRALETKQKEKEDYMFSSFKRTAGTEYFSKIDYRLVDYSTKKPEQMQEYRDDGCLRTPNSNWGFGRYGKESLQWPNYEEQGEYSPQYFRTVNKLVKRIKEKGFDVSFETGKYLGTFPKYMFRVSNNDRLTMTIPQPNPSNFHTLLTSMLLRDTVPSSDLHRYIINLGYVRTLIGVKYKDKALTLVEEGEQYKPILVLADEFRKRDYYHFFPPKIDSDIPVTQAQIEEWNQVFIDALKEDPFFGKQMSAPADTSGSTSALNALKGKTGVDAAQLRVNGVAGSQMDLGLPVYVQLKGDVDSSKTTDGVTGLVAYRFGNTAVGAIQSYSNESETSHTETSLIAAQSLGNMYIEGQLGTVSFEGGSGIRSQVRLGVDTPYGMPFVQLTHRDFGATSDTAAYVGLEVSGLELKTSDYTFSTQLIAKAGHHSVKGNVGVIEGSAKISFSHGLSVDTQVSFGSNTASKLSLNVAFEQ